MKKILLNESEKAKHIAEREQAIINSFSKTFNSIKRLDINEISEINELDFNNLHDKVLLDLKKKKLQKEFDNILRTIANLSRSNGDKNEIANLMVKKKEIYDELMSMM